MGANPCLWTKGRGLPTFAILLQSQVWKRWLYTSRFHGARATAATGGRRDPSCPGPNPSACSRLMPSAPSLVGSYIIHCVICARPSLLNMGENCHLAENHSGKREAIPTSAVLQVELWKDQSCCLLMKNREEAAVGYKNPWWKGLGEATTNFLCSAGVARHVLKNRTMHK